MPAHAHTSMPRQTVQCAFSLSGSGGESEYSGTLDKKLHSQTDYNICISKPPIQKKLVNH